MKVKWRGLISEERSLPGGGPQEAILGNLEYVSLTNNNADIVPEDERWKWVDDLSTMEKVNLLNVGLASYNFRAHVASDIPTHRQYVQPESLISQTYIDSINEWSQNHKSMLNQVKMKVIIF